MSTASGWKALASHPRSRSKLTRTPWVVVILNSIVQSRSYPGPDPRETALLGHRTECSFQIFYAPLAHLSRRPRPGGNDTGGGACGARTRSGQPCKSAPVTGRRRCRMHGGAVGSGAPKAPPGSIGARWPKTVTRSSGSEPIGSRWLKNNDPDASRFPDPVFHCGRVLASLAERPAKTVKRDPDKVRRLLSTVALPRRWGRYQERRRA